MGTDTQITANWARYVNKVVGDMPAKAVAARIKVSESTVGNWLRGENFRRPDPYKVKDFAEAFGHDPLEALVWAGLLDTSAIEHLRTRPDMTLLTIDELFGEIRRRIDGDATEPLTLTTGRRKRSRTRITAYPNAPAR